MPEQPPKSGEYKCWSQKGKVHSLLYRYGTRATWRTPFPPKARTDKAERMHAALPLPSLRSVKPLGSSEFMFLSLFILVVTAETVGLMIFASGRHLPQAPSETPSVSRSHGVPSPIVVPERFPMEPLRVFILSRLLIMCK